MSLQSCLPLILQLNSYPIREECQYLSKKFISAPIPAGVLTIGYGSTGDHVRAGLKISQSEAEALLLRDLKRFEDAVNQRVRVPITQSIFDALVSFSFNVGISAFQNSTLLRLLNNRQYAAALDQLLRWTNAGTQSLPGLVSRRQAERRLAYGERFPED